MHEQEKKRRQRLKRIVVGFVATVLTWTCAGLPLFVFPATDPLNRTDVLLVLAPTTDRIEYAEQLMDQGYAATLAVSVPQIKGSSEPEACHQKRAYKVVCFRPEPVTTQGEARALKRLSAKYAWESANVLTAQRHVTRARVLLERCNDVEVIMTATWRDYPVISLSNPRNTWAYIYAYETAAFIKAALSSDC